MELEYSVTENVHRNRSGQIVQIDYQFEETVIVEIKSSGTLNRQSKEKRNRSYDAIITREQYETITRRVSNPLSFDAFILVLRPFITGFYTSDELERAFQTLDRDHSGTININELNVFLPLLNDNLDSTALRNYVKKVDDNFDGNMNYDEFRSLVLRGIGRDIICNHL